MSYILGDVLIMKYSCDVSKADVGTNTQKKKFIEVALAEVLNGVLVDFAHNEIKHERCT